jgi:RHS repeat-associated protein
VVQGSEEYWYSNDGNRVATVRRDLNGVKTELITWVDNTEFHYSPGNVLLTAYDYADMGDPVFRVARTSGSAASSEFEFLGLGKNVLATLGPNSAVNTIFSYSPFGALLETTDSGGTTGVSAHPRRFADKYTDKISDLSYYGARYYDKVSFAWTQSDPRFRFAGVGCGDAATCEPIHSEPQQPAALL